MLYKIILSLLVVSILSSCGTDKQPTENKGFSFHPQNLITDNLIGSWTISNTISRIAGNENESICNVCPTINFATNSAVLTFPNNNTEVYNWTVSSDTLTLLTTVSTSVSTLPYFMRFKYKMDYKQGEEFLELRLSPDKDLTYVLRR